MNQTNKIQKEVNPPKKAEPKTLKALLKNDSIITQFQRVLDKHANSFMASILTVYNSDKKLKNCDPASILNAAMKAAIYNLPIDPVLGRAHIVPFGKQAGLIIDYKGLQELAYRTNQYKVIAVNPIYEGMTVELVDFWSGELAVYGEKVSDKVIMWVGCYKLKNGLEKYIQMTVEQIHDHAKKYSPSYNRADSPWKTAAAKMERKTVMRELLNHGPLTKESAQVVDALADDETPGQSMGDYFGADDVIDYTEPDEPARPWGATNIGIALSGYMSHYTQSGLEATLEQRSILRGVLDTSCGGDVIMRTMIIESLTGCRPSEQTSDSAVLALIDWLSPIADKAGYYIDEPALTEVQNVIEWINSRQKPAQPESPTEPESPPNV